MLQLLRDPHYAHTIDIDTQTRARAHRKVACNAAALQRRRRRRALRNSGGMQRTRVARSSLKKTNLRHVSMRDVQDDTKRDRSIDRLIRRRRRMLGRRSGRVPSAILI